MSTTPPKTEMSVTEFADTLTGFDEIAIEKCLGIDPYQDGERKPVMLMRALVFVDRRRQGDADAQAREFALNLRASDVTDYFAAEADEPMPDEPVSAEGNAGATLEPSPKN